MFLFRYVTVIKMFFAMGIPWTAELASYLIHVAYGPEKFRQAPRFFFLIKLWNRRHHQTKFVVQVPDHHLQRGELPPGSYHVQRQYGQLRQLPVLQPLLLQAASGAGPPSPPDDHVHRRRRHYQRRRRLRGPEALAPPLLGPGQEALRGVRCCLLEGVVVVVGGGGAAQEVVGRQDRLLRSREVLADDGDGEKEGQCLMAFKIPIVAPVTVP